MAACLIALGSNLGDRAAALNQAVQRIQDHAEIHALKCSDWLSYPPIGGPEGQSDFINGAACFETSLTPIDLLRFLHAIEADLGRERRVRWSARVVDLDLLLYEDLVLDGSEVQIPHPRMAFRRFVIEPAAQIAGDMVHPVIGWSLQQLAEHLNRARPYVAITGLPRLGKASLMNVAAEAVSAHAISDLFMESQKQATLAGERFRLEERASALRGLASPRDHRIVLSDFWIGQSLAYARLLLSGSEFQDFAASYRQQCEDLPPAKLLVNVVGSGKRPPEDIVHSGSNATGDFVDRDALNINLDQAISRQHRGPTLQLDASQPDWSRTELIAAIRAMQ